MRTLCPRTPITGAFGCFLLASVLYLSGVCPTIYWFDSSEFVTVAQTLGIGHPAGSPTYTLLAKLVTFLPLGSVALRVNAFSALISAGTIALLFLLLYALLQRSLPWVRWLAAGSGALFLLASESFWRFAEVAEVYSLQNGFLVLLLMLLLGARASSPIRQQQYVCCFALLYGLSAGVHATMAFFAPAFLCFMGLAMPRVWRPRTLAFLTFFFLLGFATYLYLPLRSLTEPIYNWGDPHTWRQFLIHISDRKDASAHTVFWARQLPFQLFMYGTHLLNEFSLLGGLLGVLGWCSLLWRDRALWLLLNLALVGHTAFFIRTWWDTAWGFIPSFVIFAIWIGCGLCVCLERLTLWYQQHPPRIPRVAVYTVLFGGLLVTVAQTLARHAPVAMQTANYAAEQYGKELLQQLPADALLFCEYSWFPLLHLQHVERQRPDLTFLLQGEIFTPQFFALVSSKRYPNITQVTSDTARIVSPNEYFWEFVQHNAASHPFFWDPDEKYQKPLREHLVPQGLLLSFQPQQKVVVTPEILQEHWQSVTQATERILQGAREEATTFFLAHRLNGLASYFQNIEDFTHAAQTYQLILSIRPEDKATANNYGALLMGHGQLPEALAQLRTVYAQEPISPVVNKNIGLLLLRLGHTPQAITFLERALNFGATDGDTYLKLSEAYHQSGRLLPALQTLRSALQQYQQVTPRNAADSHLPTKIAQVQAWIERLETQLRSDTRTQ